MTTGSARTRRTAIPKPRRCATLPRRRPPVAAAAATSKYASRARPSHPAQSSRPRANSSKPKIAFSLAHAGAFPLPYYSSSRHFTNYKLNGDYPYHDLVIYEMGGGNGTLAQCAQLHQDAHHLRGVCAHAIQDHRDLEPLGRAAAAQSRPLRRTGWSASKVEVINELILRGRAVADPCFLLPWRCLTTCPRLGALRQHHGEPHQVLCAAR